MILQAYGIPFSSPVQVSELLSDLGLTHSVCGAQGAKSWQRNIDLNATQPAWPVVVDRIHTASKLKPSKWSRVVFVCDSPSALAMCNVQIIRDCNPQTIKDALRAAVSNPVPSGWTLEIKEPSIMDYVESATKPSHLNHIQTALYRISPYALRKDAQAATIAYFDGRLGMKALKAKLKSSFKLEPLLQLCVDDKATELRNAVAEFKKTQRLEEVAKEFGVETFEILYVVRSSERNK